MPPRSRRKQATGSTAVRGYGQSHQIRRKYLIDHMTDGQPCGRCGLPMYRADAGNLDADHSDPRALNPNSVADRLLHRGCNRNSAYVNQAKRQAAQGGTAGMFDVVAADPDDRSAYCAREW